MRYLKCMDEKNFSSKLIVTYEINLQETKLKVKAYLIISFAKEL